MRNHSNENEFDLHENGHAGEIHFHMNGFARRVVLTQRKKVTRKWPILVSRSVQNESSFYSLSYISFNFSSNNLVANQEQLHGLC